LSQPGTIVFDGSNVWVEHVASGGNFVDKLRASDNQYLGSYLVGGNSVPAGFDGVKIIAPDHGNNPGPTLTYYQACNSASSSPLSLAFDGANMWVGCEGVNQLGKM
jgi:hypothetical protein